VKKNEKRGRGKEREKWKGRKGRNGRRKEYEELKERI
jgi:hypothetical protein